MYLVTLRIENLRDLAQLPEEFDMLECKPDLGGITAPAADRWNGSTRILINHPEVPFTGNYQDTVDKFLEKHAGERMSYGQVKGLLEEYPEAAASASQVRAIMKNYGLITKE